MATQLRGHTLTIDSRGNYSYEVGTHPLRCEWQDWPTIQAGGNTRPCPGLVEWICLWQGATVAWLYVCPGHSVSDRFYRYTKVKL